MIDKVGRLCPTSEIHPKCNNQGYCSIMNELERNDHNSLFLRNELEDLKAQFANFAIEHMSESTKLRNDAKILSLNAALENMNQAHNSNIGKMNSVTSQIWSAMKTMKDAIQVHEAEIGSTITAVRLKDGKITQHMKELAVSHQENRRNIENLKNLYEKDKSVMSQQLEEQFGEIKYSISDNKELFFEKLNSTEKKFRKFINYQIEDVKSQFLPTSPLFDHVRALIKSEIVAASEKVEEKIETTRKQLLDQFVEKGLNNIRTEIEYLKMSVEDLDRERVRDKNRMKESLNILSDKIHRSREKLNSQMRTIDTRVTTWVKEKNRQMFEEIKTNLQEKIKSEIQIERNIIRNDIKNLQGQIDSLDYTNNFNDHFAKINDLCVKIRDNTKTIGHLKSEQMKIQDKLSYMINKQYANNHEESAEIYQEIVEKKSHGQAKESDDYTYLYSNVSTISSIKEKPNKSMKKLKRK